MGTSWISRKEGILEKGGRGMRTLLPTEVGGIYTMENNDVNTDYHKFVRVGDEK